MEKIPKEKLVDEMFEKTKHEEYMLEKHAKHTIEHLAIFLSLATVFILLVLYSFNNGYYKVYNISTNCITVNLQDFLPAALQLCGIFIYLVLYTVQIKKDKIMQIKRPNLLRILYGEFIIYILLINNNIDHLIGSLTTLIISFIFPIIIELFWWLMKKPRKYKEYDASVKKIVLTGMIEDRILYLIYNKSLIWVVLVIIISSSYWGNLCAKAENEFQIFTKENVEYAVIIDRKDDVIAEKITRYNSTLNIDTTSYAYIPKKNMIFSVTVFEKVVIN